MHITHYNINHVCIYTCFFFNINITYINSYGSFQPGHCEHILYIICMIYDDK